MFWFALGSQIPKGTGAVPTGKVWVVFSSDWKGSYFVINNETSNKHFGQARHQPFFFFFFSYAEYLKQNLGAAVGLGKHGVLHYFSLFLLP